MYVFIGWQRFKKREKEKYAYEDKILSAWHEPSIYENHTFFTGSRLFSPCLFKVTMGCMLCVFVLQFTECNTAQRKKRTNWQCRRGPSLQWTMILYWRSWSSFSLLDKRTESRARVRLNGQGRRNYSRNYFPWVENFAWPMLESVVWSRSRTDSRHLPCS